MFYKNLIVGAAVIFCSSIYATPALAKQKVKLDGSSTVYPISEAVAEEFGKKYRDIRVTVGVSGTGGGFKKFVNREIDISGASRPVKGKELVKMTPKNINFVELPIAYDGISIVVNPKNYWVDSLSIEELNRIWMPGSKIKTWSDVRREWPNKEIKLYGPGGESGTFEYFTKKVNGKAMASRADYTASEDDNVLVHGISGDKYALGYFGYGYYAENKNKLKIVPVSYKGNAAVVPSPKTIENGKYKPLSRPVFIYVDSEAAKRSEVRTFVDFYLANVAVLAGQVGYVPLPASIYTKVKARWAITEKGSAYSGAKKIKNLLK